MYSKPLKFDPDSEHLSGVHVSRTKQKAKSSVDSRGAVYTEGKTARKHRSCAPACGSILRQSTRQSQYPFGFSARSRNIPCPYFFIRAHWALCVPHFSNVPQGVPDFANPEP